MAKRFENWLAAYGYHARLSEAPDSPELATAFRRQSNLPVIGSRSRFARAQLPARGNKHHFRIFVFLRFHVLRRRFAAEPIASLDER